ncbi:MAG: hypothetical protein LUQ04_03265 [Methanoregula sp.]|nr:hypothetical protein [Methanoregula sp.]
MLSGSPKHCQNANMRVVFSGGHRKKAIDRKSKPIEWAGSIKENVMTGLTTHHRDRIERNTHQ